MDEIVKLRFACLVESITRSCTQMIKVQMKNYGISIFMKVWVSQLKMTLDLNLKIPKRQHILLFGLRAIEQFSNPFYSFNFSLPPGHLLYGCISMKSALCFNLRNTSYRALFHLPLHHSDRFTLLSCRRNHHYRRHFTFSYSNIRCFAVVKE